MEHDFEFGRELETTFGFELGKHVSFGIIVGRLIVKDSLCQVNLIISFEYVLLGEEFEQADGFI